jgi:hypothetical protein
MMDICVRVFILVYHKVAAVQLKSTVAGYPDVLCKET